ncbi:hypothetical protein PAXRUDRAFT_525602 [Paxillus rubicundulus Ve08.2h10]|uniref:Uncharacterized protein n=1 Tax=Paxillus rubicundulus Ve08.2h10 TaxID=930991 RepID=A0A0D0E0F3_9AGAM|nr:hypothetical protein PAXRUDRAFT_525602 [Paxillus rubicundulus Ve08.2h10]
MISKWRSSHWSRKLNKTVGYRIVCLSFNSLAYLPDRPSHQLGTLRTVRHTVHEERSHVGGAGSRQTLCERKASPPKLIRVRECNDLHLGTAIRSVSRKPCCASFPSAAAPLLSSDSTS